MACERSQDLDLSAFLAAPRDEEFAGFRDHYPRCAECAAEVRAWTELHEALAAAHPEPEQLARYEALPPAERASLDRHLAGCPSCREELARLASFDPARLTAPASPAEPRRSWLAGLGRIVWSPAFAYGVAVLLIIPLVQRLPSRDAQKPLAEQVSELGASSDADLRLEDSKKDEVAKSVVAQPPAVAPARKRPAPQAPREIAETAEEAVVSELEADDLARNVLAQGDVAKEKVSAPTVIRREGSAFASAVAPADSPSPSDVLKLESYRTARVQVPRSPLRISVPVPAGTKPGEAWLRVVSADGRRELRERVEVPADGRVEISVPADWLTVGSYRLELEGSSASYRFEVTQPSSRRSSSRATP